EELAQTPAFQALVEREFKHPVGDWTTPLSRRRFLTLLGASFALAGLSGCGGAPREPIMPYVRPPDGITPGRPLFFATPLPPPSSPPRQAPRRPPSPAARPRAPWPAPPRPRPPPTPPPALCPPALPPTRNTARPTSMPRPPSSPSTIPTAPAPSPTSARFAP